MSGHSVEEIVREVLRRIGEQGISSEQKNELLIDDRVVTLAGMGERLAGVERLVVRRGAVVTPALRDELRRRKVSLTFADAKEKQHDETTLVVAIDVADDGRWKRVLGSVTGSIEYIEQSNIPERIAVLADRVGNGKKLGVVLSDIPSVALCVLNRQRGLRAALGTDAKAVGAAVKTLAANVLVLDTTTASLHAVRNLIRQFARGGWRECPAELKSLLEGQKN